MFKLCDIRRARKGKKLTIDTASKAIGAHRSRISRIEDGTGKATLAELETLATAYGFNILLVDAGEMRILQAFEAEKVNYRAKTAKNKGECSE
jgi:transcriptional regulator with XRE-family HTH domain